MFFHLHFNYALHNEWLCPSNWDGRYKWWLTNAYTDSQMSSAALYDEVRIDHAVFLSSHVLCLIASQSRLWLSINSKRGWGKKKKDEWSNSEPFQSIELLMFRNWINFIVINAQFLKSWRAGWDTDNSFFIKRHRIKHCGKMPQNCNKAKRNIENSFSYNDV